MTSAHRVALLRDLTRQVAYQLWVARGRPFGSPEVDWFHAEVVLAHPGPAIALTESFGLSQDGPWLGHLDTRFAVSIGHTEGTSP